MILLPRKMLWFVLAALLLLLPGPGRRSSAPPVFDWHGYRAGLDEAGGGGPPAGLDDLESGGVRWVGVPQDHSGSFERRNYIAGLRARGIKIIRTTERRWNAGLGGRDLGALILAWETPSQPGPFFEEYARNLKAPCEGIGWNLEHDILDREKYPLTRADRRLAALWGMALAVGDRSSYVAFRCRQFALLFEIYFETARRAHPECTLAIGYSGYQGARYDGLPLEAAYGCDWNLLGRSLSWRGHAFAPITHAMCAWHTSVELPAGARAPRHSLPILHTIQLSPALEREPANLRAQIRDRLARLRPGDGLGLVGFGVPEVWDAPDREIHRRVGEEMRRQGWLPGAREGVQEFHAGGGAAFAGH